MHFPHSSHPPVEYSGSEAGNLKQTAWEIPTDGAFVLTLMGSLSRMLDQGLSLSVVVETPNLKTSSNCIHFTISSPAVEFFALAPHTSVQRVHKWRSACCPPVADAAGRDKFPIVP